MLYRTRAGPDDATDFEAFVCCDPHNPLPWVLETQIFVQGHVLKRRVNITLAFRQDGQLVAVSSFYSDTIGLPLVSPVRQPCWHLDVIAVRLDLQGAGLASDIFAHTFSEMRAEDPGRVLVKGLVHRSNEPSLKACELAGITPLQPWDENYWIVLGEVPAQ